MNKRGFAALMTTIVVSGIISTVLFSVVFGSYLAQSSVTDRELKEESKFSAVSCITAISLLFAEFGDFNQGVLQVASIPDCTIHSIRIEGSNRIIEVESAINRFYTLVRATINVSSNKIIDLEELASF